MAEPNHIPEDVREAVEGVRPGADIRLLAFSDLTPEGSFGEQFLALAGDHLLIFSSDGESPRLLRDLPFADVSKVEIETLVGGAALTRNFTRRRSAPCYGGLTVYAKDAMNGLDLANRILDPAALTQPRARQE